MIGALAAKQPLSQAEAIRLATEKSVRGRNLYTEQTVAELTAMLAAAEEEVRRAILRYKSLGSLPDNKLAALEGLKKLQTDIQENTSRLHREQTLLFRKTAITSFRQGVYRGIVEFAAAQFATPLVVVMGHTRCGAILATIEELEQPAEERSPNLRSIVDRVLSHESLP